MICLDTNAVITLLNERDSSIETRLQRAMKRGTPATVSTLVLFELLYGAAKSAQRERNTARVADFMAGRIGPLHFDAEDAREAADIRVSLERVGKPIGPYDVIIAAQARRRGALLVTANEREFARVPGLRTEDWARSG